MDWTVIQCHFPFLTAGICEDLKFLRNVEGFPLQETLSLDPPKEAVAPHLSSPLFGFGMDWSGVEDDQLECFCI